MHRIIPILLLLPLIVALVTSCSADSTPPPHPTVIVITAAGPYIAQFDDPQDWLLGETDTSWGRLVDGEYVLTIKKPRQIAWANQTRTFGDGIYEVDARLSSGPEASGFGMLMIGSSDLSAFLYVMITGDGRYDVGFCDQSCAREESLIGGYKLAPAILVDNARNHIKVELKEHTLTLIINGASVSQVQNLSYGRGVVGIVGESSQYGGFEAAFDNLSVVELQPIPPTVITTVTPEGATPEEATPEPITPTAEEVTPSDSETPVLLEPTFDETP